MAQAAAQESRAVQATIGDSEFDRDTAVTLREEGVYDAELSAGWTIIHAVNGGYLLALLGRALGEALPHSDPFSVSAHYLTASVPGPAVIRTQVVRTGRTLSTGEASLFQFAEDGTEIERIRVLATYGDLDGLSDDIRTSAEPPAFPPLEQCLGTSDGASVIPGSSAITERLDIKLDPATVGWAVGAPSGKGEMRGWFGLADGRDADPLSLLLTVDALPPTSSAGRPRGRCVSPSPPGISREASWRRTRTCGTAPAASSHSPASWPAHPAADPRAMMVR